MPFESTKTYGHEQGLSCCFRQHKAKSHCKLLHGYALSVKITFACTHLDEHNWVMDFGGLKEIKQWLADNFDHTVVIARDDPFLPTFENLDRLKLAKLVLLPAVGCEAFARHISIHTQQWLNDREPGGRVWVASVEVREHGANSAIWKRD